jgi:hypothetical protein
MDGIFEVLQITFVHKFYRETFVYVRDQFSHVVQDSILYILAIKMRCQLFEWTLPSAKSCRLLVICICFESEKEFNATDSFCFNETRYRPGKNEVASCRLSAWARCVITSVVTKRANQGSGSMFSRGDGTSSPLREKGYD